MILLLMLVDIVDSNLLILSKYPIFDFKPQKFIIQVFTFEIEDPIEVDLKGC